MKCLVQNVLIFNYAELHCKRRTMERKMIIRKEICVFFPMTGSSDWTKIDIGSCYYYSNSKSGRNSLITILQKPEWSSDFCETVCIWEKLENVMESSVRNCLCLWEAVTPSTITASQGSKPVFAVKENCKKMVGLGSVFFPEEGVG